MFYDLYDLWFLFLKCFVFSRYFFTTCFQRSYGEGLTSFLLFRRTFWNIGACLPFRKFHGTSYKTNTNMDGKTRFSKRAPQSQPFLGNASSFLKSFYKNPVRWYVYIHFLIFVFFYSQYMFCQSACGSRKHDEKKTKKTQIKKRNQSQLDCRVAT